MRNLFIISTFLVTLIQSSFVIAANRDDITSSSPIRLFDYIASEYVADENQSIDKMYEHAAQNFDQFFSQIDELRGELKYWNTFYNFDFDEGKYYLMVEPISKKIAAISYYEDGENPTNCQNKKKEYFKELVEKYYGQISYNTISSSVKTQVKNIDYIVLSAQKRALVLYCWETDDYTDLYIDYGDIDLIKSAQEQYVNYITRLKNLKRLAEKESLSLLKESFIPAASTLETQLVKTVQVDYLDGAPVDINFLKKAKSVFDKLAVTANDPLSTYQFSKIPHLTCTQVTWRANSSTGLTVSWATHSIWHTDLPLIAGSEKQIELVVAREKAYDAVLDTILTKGQCDEEKTTEYVIEDKNVFELKKFK